MLKMNPRVTPGQKEKQSLVRLKVFFILFLGGQTMKNGKQIIRGCQNFSNITHTWKQIKNILILQSGQA